MLRFKLCSIVKKGNDIIIEGGIIMNSGME